MIFKGVYTFSIVVLSTLVINGCGIISALKERTGNTAELNETGVVISRNVYIRSSYAVVAADLLELKRGETVWILDENTFDRVLWYRVRAFDEDNTEGWIEAQHIIKGDMVDKSKKLSEKSVDTQTQAIGKLRATSNLRLTPEKRQDNILLRLDDGSTFEIIDWEYVEKEGKGSELNSEKINDAKGADESERLDQKYNLWYKVRIDSSISPVPMGWVFGRQINLQVPSDIIYYQTNKRKFASWYSLDGGEAPWRKTFDTNSDFLIAKPRSWIILSRTNEVRAIYGKEPDFDGIIVLGYDKYREEHYEAYNTNRQRLEIWGMLPAKLEGSGNRRTFTVKLRNEDTGRMEYQSFTLFKDKRERLRITPPKFLTKRKRKRK